MDCSSEKCTFTGTERMVSCWLCVEPFHLRCTGGLKPRDADALADAGKHLQWTCPRCRMIGVEFYNFFKNSRGEFDRINNDLVALQAKFSKYGELFTKFHNLDKFAGTLHPSSPKKKKTPALTTISEPLNLIDMNTISPLPSTSANSNVAPPVESVTATPVMDSSSMPAFNFTASIDPKRTLRSSSKSAAPLDHHASGISNGLPSGPKKLTVVKPRKTIFVSRLARDTTVDDLLFYVKSKIDVDLDILCFKINADQNRSISSFRLIVPCEIFDRIVDPEFWPIGILVREYVYRENSRSKPAVLPSNVRNQLNPPGN